MIGSHFVRFVPVEFYDGGDGAADVAAAEGGVSAEREDAASTQAEFAGGGSGGLDDVVELFVREEGTLGAAGDDLRHDIRGKTQRQEDGRCSHVDIELAIGAIESEAVLEAGGADELAGLISNPGAVKHVRGDPANEQQFFYLFKRRMASAERRSHGAVKLIKGRGPRGGLAPVDDGGGQFLGAIGVESEAEEQSLQVDGSDGVDVVFGGFGNDFDLGVAGGEGHAEAGDTGGPEAGGAVGIAADIAAPLHPKDGAIDGAGGKVVGAGLLDSGGSPLGFAPDGGGD